MSAPLFAGALLFFDCFGKRGVPLHFLDVVVTVKVTVRIADKLTIGNTLFHTFLFNQIGQEILDIIGVFYIDNVKMSHGLVAGVTTDGSEAEHLLNQGSL